MSLAAALAWPWVGEGFLETSQQPIPEQSHTRGARPLLPALGPAAGREAGHRQWSFSVPWSERLEEALQSTG